MMIRYPIIFAELCVSCEQFVNVAVFPSGRPDESP